MRLSWRQAPAPMTLAWRGPTGALLAAAARDPMAVIAALIGPPGPAGSGGGGSGTFSIDDGTASASGTFTFDDGAA